MKYKLRWEETLGKISIVDGEHLGWYKYPCPVYGFEKKSSVFTVSNNVLYGYYSEEDMKNNSEAAYKFYLKKENLQKIIDTILLVGEKNKSFIKRARDIGLATATNRQLIEILKENYEMYLESIGVHYFSMPQSFWKLEEHIKKELNELGVKNIEETFLDLTAPTKPSIIEESNKELLEKTKKKQEEIYRKLKISDTTKHLLLVIKELGWYRLNHTRIYQTDCRSLDDDIFKILTGRFPLTVDQFHLCFHEEIWDLLEKNEVSRELLNQISEREKFFLLKTNSLDREVYSGQKAKDKFKKLIKEEDYSSLKEIKGVSGNIGVVKGKARVFRSETFNVQQCNEEMQEGEILIVQNSWPELLPACSKASAIVTNEGGICSHGSVVSREFNIPCVVGTIIATRSFNTGDIVEVNGDKGIVRKIG